MQPLILFTAGYEGRSIDEFVELLQANGVNKLLDVRQNAFSFKPFFSKKALKAKIEESGIEYVHEPALGTPKEIRARLKENEDYPAFFADYEKHLSKQNGTLTSAVALAYEGRACLMCFEADHEKCHRSALAEKIRDLGGNGLKIVHL